MKKIVMALSIFCIAISVHGQNWPNLGTEWTYQVISTGWSEYLHIRADRDTLIDNEPAKVLESNVLIYLTSPGGDSTIFHSKTPIPNDLIIKDEDGAIYFRDEDEWNFIYDFNAVIGDTWNVEGTDSTVCFNLQTQEEYDPPEYSEYIIEDIIDIEYANKSVTAFKLQYNEQQWNFSSIAPSVFLNIGSRGSFLPYLICDDNHNKYQNIYMLAEGLMCFDDTNGFEISTDPICEEIALISNTLSPKYNDSDLISIYPNPTESILNIETSELISSISRLDIYDIYGHLVISISNPIKSINVSGLNNGIYICSFKLDNHQVITKKILKL